MRLVFGEAEGLYIDGQFRRHRRGQEYGSAISVVVSIPPSPCSTSQERRGRTVERYKYQSYIIARERGACARMLSTDIVDVVVDGNNAMQRVVGELRS